MSNGSDGVKFKVQSLEFGIIKQPRMKKFLFFLICTSAFLHFCSLSFAQEEEIKEQKEKTKPHFDFGGNISFGYGSIYNTGSIQKYYDQQKSDSLEKTISTKWGTVWGISGVVSFVLNDRFHLNTGIQFQSQKNNIELEEEENFSNGNFNKISSTARISVASVQIPLTMKIRFLTGEQNPFEGEIHPYIKVGLSYEKHLSKTLDLNESITDFDKSRPAKDRYETTRNSFSRPVKFDGYGNSALNYIIGGGVDMILLEYDKTTFTMEISFSSNFGKEELWVENLPSPKGDNPTNREIFDKSKAKELNINDWKSSNIRITVGLLF